MDIYAEKGHKVKFLNKHGEEYEREAASKLLNTEDIYTVEFIDVGGWFSYVKLEGIPGLHNTVMFADAEDIEEEIEEVIEESEPVKKAFRVVFKTHFTNGSDVVIVVYNNEKERDEIIKNKIATRYNSNADYVQIKSIKEISLEKVRLGEITLEDFAILFDLRSGQERN